MHQWLHVDGGQDPTLANTAWLHGVPGNRGFGRCCGVRKIGDGWFVIPPANEIFHPQNWEYLPERYPTKEAAMAACLLIYG